MLYVALLLYGCTLTSCMLHVVTSRVAEESISKVHWVGWNDNTFRITHATGTQMQADVVMDVISNNLHLKNYRFEGRLTVLRVISFNNILLQPGHFVF